MIEMTEFIIVLNTPSALRAFMAAGSLTLGGNMSLAVGPIGRNGELSGNINSKGKVAAMYSYSKTKGLFGGLSIEGSVILERQDANCTAYDDPRVTSRSLLGGQIPPPPWAGGLIDALEKSTGVVKGWVQEESPIDSTRGGPSYAFGGGIPSPAIGEVGSGVSSSGDTGRRSRNNPLKKSVSSMNGSINGVINGVDSYFPTSTRRTSDRSTVRRQEEALEREDHQSNLHATSPFAPLPSSNNDALFNLGASNKPPPSYGFATHFDSDFDPVRDGSHRRNKSSLSSISTNGSGAGRAPAYTGPSQAQVPEEDDDPFNIFTEPTGTRQAPSGRSSYERSGDAESYHSSTQSHAYSQNSSGQPTRKLSVKRELRDPAPSGLDRAIALYDYNAQQVLNFLIRLYPL